jgi:PAS domain S-box-containing protein
VDTLLELSPALVIVAVVVAVARRIRFERASMRRLTRSADAAEARYRSLIERLPLIVYEDAPDEFSSSIFISPQTTAMLGYSPQDWQDDKELYVKLLHPDDLEQGLSFLAQTRPNDIWTKEYRMIARDGRTVWIRDTGVTVFDEDGVPICYQG